MDHTHPFGKPLDILKFLEKKEVIGDNKELENIFNHPEIQDRKIVILSLIGAFRGGKSFFLDYCLRFLYANFPSINNPSKFTQTLFKNDDSWIGSADEPLKGFSWRSGTKRDTTGVIMWSDVFLHSMDRNGEKIAIFVMDTQGLFDNDSTPTDNSRIFALGTLISSIQVLNLKQQVQEDHLQYLQFATEFAQFTLKKKMKMEGKPFQNMTFLIRDWENNEEFRYGTAGGHEYLKEVLAIQSDQSRELKAVRKSIFDSFEQVNCCLLPYPGEAVAGNKHYDGRWSEMDRTFKSELKSAIEHILHPDNLVIKKINSKDIRVNEMKLVIQVYMTLFQSNEIPQAMSIYEYTVERHMNDLIEKCFDMYEDGIFKSDLKNVDDIPVVHKKWKYQTIQWYDDENKMGSKLEQESFRSKLNEQIEEKYKKFKSLNERKSNRIVQCEENSRQMSKNKISSELRSSQEQLKQEKTKVEEMEKECKEKHENHEWQHRERKVNQERHKSKNSYEDIVLGGARTFGIIASIPFAVAFGIIGVTGAAVIGSVHGGIIEGVREAGNVANDMGRKYKDAFKRFY